jgi:hypothetical protein
MGSTALGDWSFLTAFLMSKSSLNSPVPGVLLKMSGPRKSRMPDSGKRIPMIYQPP